MNRAIALKTRQLPLLLAVVIVLSLGGATALAGQLPAIPAFQSPPPNDNFANATLISALPFTDRVDNALATTETGEPQYCNPSSNTVWYIFTPPTDMLIHVDMSGGQPETNLVVYQASSSGIGGLSYISCSSWYPDWYPVTEFQAQAGSTYYFQAGSLNGPGTLQINVSELPPPVNDNFASAKVISSLPFPEVITDTDNTDTRSASTEPGEPTSSCSTAIHRTVWYAYTPGASGAFSIWADGWYDKVVAVYTGGDLESLSEVACRVFWGGGRLTFHGDSGTTYYIQVGGTYYDGEWLHFRLDVAPPPTAEFWLSPGDPSVFDTIQFYNNSSDPAEVGIQTTAWDFGDGTTSSEWSPSHKYAKDGDYTVSLTVTTVDGRTASATQTVQVATHDVAIVRLTAPTAARVGQTRSIVVQIRNSRYPERVHVELLKSIPGGFQWVTSTEQNIPVRAGGRTTAVNLGYTFTSDDSMMGKVTFRVSAWIVDKRDVLPADNEAIAFPTKVSKK